MSLLFYTFFLLVWLVLMAIIYSILNGAGLFNELVEIGDRAVVPELQSKLTLGTVEKWTFFIGVVCVIVGSLLNALLAFLYNVFADLIGGIDVTFSEREQ